MNILFKKNKSKCNFSNKIFIRQFNSERKKRIKINISILSRDANESILSDTRHQISGIICN